MSDRYLEIQRESGHVENSVPSGQQLPRTSPLTDVKRRLDFCNGDQNEDCDETQQRAQAGSRNQDENELNGTFEIKPLETIINNRTSMLKGMDGYEVTSSDLEFMEKMNEEKLSKKLQGDLEEIQRLLKTEMIAFELTCATREKAQAELKKFPSCEDLTQWIKVVVKRLSPQTDLTDLDFKSLLAMVTEKDIQTAIDEKKIEATQMKMMVAKKKKKEAKEQGRLEKQLASEQMKIQGMMSQLFTLKSELQQQEEVNKACELQISAQKANEEAAEEVKTLDEPQDTEVKSRGKERKKVVRFNVQESTNESKSTRSKVPEGKTKTQRGAQRSKTQAAAEDQQQPGLRRSKRIASRK